jgi:GDP-L-fucose synthase
MTRNTDRPRTCVAGHRGMVGGAILRQLDARGDTSLVRTHVELDLKDQAAVRDLM